MNPINPEKFLSLAEWLGEEFLIRLDEGPEAVEAAARQEFGITITKPDKDNAYERTIALHQQEQHENAALKEAAVAVNSFALQENLDTEFAHLDAIEKEKQSETGLDQAELLAQINRIHETDPPKISTPAN